MLKGKKKNHRMHLKLFVLPNWEVEIDQDYKFIGIIVWAELCILK